MSADLERAVEQVAVMSAVYRMYDRVGGLLYIGSSGNPAERLCDHAEKRWYPLVATIKLEWFPDRDAASAAETAAIQSERPRFNIVGLPRRPRPRAPLPVAGPASLREAVGMHVLRCSLEAARKASRRPGFPAPVGKRGKAHVYDVDDLLAWQESRARTR